jgi:tetratricopeptide (TPR) repeat protein
MHKPKQVVRAAEVASQGGPGQLTDGMFREAVNRHQLGQLPQAEALYRAIIAIHSAPADANYNLGLLLQSERRYPDAEIAYRHAIAIRPDYVEALSNLGTVLQELQRFDEAVEMYRQAIARRPDFAMAYTNLGTALKEQNKFEEAIAAYEHSLVLSPDSALVLANLGAALLEQQHYAKAEAVCRHALALNPTMTIAHCNLGASFKAQNKLAEAAAAYRSAVAADPDFPEAHFSLAQILFLQGDLRDAWDEYEWRWKLAEYVWVKSLHGIEQKPRWQGEPLYGRAILIYAEQGLGDTIQFARFIPGVVARGGRVVFAVHPPLVGLLGCIDDVTIVPLTQSLLPAFDVHCPLLSLPRLFGTTLETIPAEHSYLRAGPSAVERWASRIHGEDLRVGIIWAGNAAQRGDRLRSPHLAAMAPLFAAPGVSFVALQLGDGRKDIAATPLPDNVRDLGTEIIDFTDTAAVMTGLDLVITSCTASLHMAAALGIPTWAVLPFAPHFFWLLDRQDSPWYPALRLYRQDDLTSGWTGVIARVGSDLAQLSAETVKARRAAKARSKSMPESEQSTDSNRSQ